MKTLAEFEALCAQGPKSGLTPTDFFEATQLVAAYMDKYQKGIAAQFEQWKAPVRPRHRAAASAMFGLERSLPAGDREGVGA